MNSRRIIFLASLFITLALRAQDEAGVTRLLTQLQSQNIETRQTAMFELQTSLDPRIPDACLTVLNLEGDSIRRLAARAIGSRWHQIPKERVPAFTAALKAQLKSGHDGLANMARRGIALLDRNYGDPMLSRSRSKRWVVYERFGLPCVIDTKNSSEELLGFGSEAKMSCAWGNRELAPTTQWHPKKDMVALEIIEGRKLSTVWLWIHGKGLRQLTWKEMAKALGHQEEEIAASAGFFTEIAGWKGDNLDFSLTFTVKKGDNFVDHEAKLRWSSATDKLSVVSDKVTP